VYFGLASAFVHSAKSDPWEFVVNENEASGRPLLLAGGDGLLFDANRDEAIRDALVRSTDQSGHRLAAMVRRARLRVDQWSSSLFGQNMGEAISRAVNLW
jgi:hypothetical protein